MLATHATAQFNRMPLSGTFRWAVAAVKQIVGQTKISAYHSNSSLAFQVGKQVGPGPYSVVASLGWLVLAQAGEARHKIYYTTAERMNVSPYSPIASLGT